MADDMIKLQAMERTRNFFQKNNGIKEIRLEDLKSNPIKCKRCPSTRFKLYTKFGGNTYNKAGKMINSFPVTYNYACNCGEMLVLKEGTFKNAKVKYGCSTNKCPKQKTKMDLDCLKCEFLYEK